MRILCAVDGSECSRWGVQALEALADREPEDVTLLHVVDPSALRTGRGGILWRKRAPWLPWRRPVESSSAKQSDRLESLSDRPRPTPAPDSTTS